MMEIKPIIWIASTKSDLISLPEDIQDEIGHGCLSGGNNEKEKTI
jgi:hypothetical protein